MRQADLIYLSASLRESLSHSQGAPRRVPTKPTRLARPPKKTKGRPPLAWWRPQAPFAPLFVCSARPAATPTRWLARTATPPRTSASQSAGPATVRPLGAQRVRARARGRGRLRGGRGCPNEGANRKGRLFGQWRPKGGDQKGGRSSPASRWVLIYALQELAGQEWRLLRHNGRPSLSRRGQRKSCPLRASQLVASRAPCRLTAASAQLLPVCRSNRGSRGS